jgi:hypothetical protein
MVSTQQTNRPGEDWRSCPTTNDLIRETNRLTVEARGLPAGMQVYDFAPILKAMNLPLRPLAESEKWAEGGEQEQVHTRDGQLFCTFVRRSNGCSYLDFTEHARNLVAAYKAR